MTPRPKDRKRAMGQGNGAKALAFLRMSLGPHLTVVLRGYLAPHLGITPACAWGTIGCQGLNSGFLHTKLMPFPPDCHSGPAARAWDRSPALPTATPKLSEHPRRAKRYQDIQALCQMLFGLGPCFTLQVEWASPWLGMQPTAFNPLHHRGFPKPRQECSLITESRGSPEPHGVCVAQTPDL